MKPFGKYTQNIVGKLLYPQKPTFHQLKSTNKTMKDPKRNLNLSIVNPEAIQNSIKNS